MTISEQIQALQTDKTNIANAITAKGGSVQAGDGFDDFATDIATIPTGITPSGNKAITATTSTQTGIDVTNYATASVAPTPSESKTLTLGSSVPTTVTPTTGKYLSSVPVSIDNTVIKASNIAQGVTILGIAGTHSGGGGPEMYIPLEVSATGNVSKPTSGITWTFPSSAKNISGSRTFYYSCYQCTGITHLDMSSITTISGSYACSNFFYQSTGLRSVNMSGLKTVTGSYALDNSFNGCTNLTSLDLSNLTSVSGSNGMSSAFKGCTGLTGSLDLSSLTTVSGSMGATFQDCTGITSVDLSSLTSVTGSTNNTFRGCTSLTSANLSSLTTVGTSATFNGMFRECSSLISVYMPNLKNVSSSSTVLTNMFWQCTSFDVNTATRYFENLNGPVVSNFCYGVTSMNDKNIIFPNLKTINSSIAGATLSSFTAYVYRQNYWFLALTNLGSNVMGAVFSGIFNSATTLGTSGEMYFPELTYLGIGLTSQSTTCCFNSNANLRKVYFPKLNSKHATGSYYFNNTNNLSEIHFGIENQAAVQAFAGYSVKWGAANATIYFDLVNHITVNGTTYDRYGNGYIIDPVIANKANNLYSWKDSGGNIIYTKEAWTPAIGDAIYNSSGVATGQTIGAIA